MKNQIVNVNPTRVGDIKDFAVDPNSNLSAGQQQLQQFADLLYAPEGEILKITAKNNNAAAQTALLLDTFGCAAAAGRSNHADVAITTSFPGGHAGLKSRLAGNGKLMVLGLSLTASSEAEFETLAMRYYNGGIKKYDYEELDTDIEAAKDTEAQDQKTRILKLKFLLTGYAAFAFTLQAGSSLSLYCKLVDPMKVARQGK